ncbi:MAG: sel1 repeat family protein, partial [Desulfovibrionaceae bacterium]|nr:sel1 repeat family protein [Desulfovibrionaceae bacterium]
MKYRIIFCMALALLLGQPALAEAADTQAGAAAALSANATLDEISSLAQAGNAEAQFQLARRYEAGQGVTQNYQQALFWYQKAAAQNHVIAQNNLGGMYNTGRGVAQDRAQAAAWYRKAAEQGSAAAQNNLGGMYKNGQGVAKDNEQAVFWFR